MSTAGYAVFEKDRDLRVSDGTPIRYTIRGAGRAPGEAIVLASGWSCSDAYWAEILPRLEAAGHRIVLPDTRGHGESGLPRDPGPRARNLSEET
jgi:pimeloyl-ACP methyl ester carboxylesterase